MSKQNKFGILIFLLIFSFVFQLKTTNAGTPPEKIHITQNKIWAKDTPDLIFDKMIVIENGATLTIEKGTKIVFKVNPSQPFDSAGFEVADGKLIINGTREDNVILTSSDDGFVLSFTDNKQTSFMRYVTLENGGFIPTTEGSGDFVPHIPVITVVGGKAHIENSKFINSRFDEVVVSGENSYDDDGNPIFKEQLEVINSNFSNKQAVRTHLDCWAYDEIMDDNFIDQNCLKGIYLKNNWYNHAFGPTTDNDRKNAVEKGYNVSGQFFLDSWRTDEEIINPVIVIPGITGSAEVSGVWKMDPILHTYDDLLESLAVNGYTKNKNLFEFPYDWRYSNKVTAQKLQAKIDAIIVDSKISRVDLVAHSMGGLVARQYIESDAYENNVDELVTLGTPHNGSPESYLKWEAGEGFFTMQDEWARHHFDMEALHEHYTNTPAYIQEQILSVKDLLPDYNYLFDVAQGSTRKYSNGYPKNSFLEELNSEANVEKLKKVDFTNIIGVLDNNKSTISKIRVVNSTVEDQWANGMPENFYDSRTDRGLENDKGDGTVPETSAKNISSNKIFRTNAKHADLPTKAQCTVVEVLLQKENCIVVDKIHIPNILLFNIFSPIDIQIIAPDGKRVGKDFVTGEVFDEIEGAYYSGYETENEFLTIPNPIDGEYKILTQGTGEGDFKVETTEISEQEDGSAQESTVALVGKATLDAENAFTVKVADETVIDPNAQDEVDEDQNDDSQDVQAEQESVIEETQEVVAESSHEKKSSKKDDNQLAVVESSEPQVSVNSDSRDENSIVANLKNGFDKLSQDIELAKTAQAEEVIKKNSETGSGSGKIVFEIFASLAAVFVARKGLVFFLAKL